MDREPFRPLHVLGITGPIGCGKSLVGAMTVRLGAREHIDADVLTHREMQARTATSAAIAAQFGDEVLEPNGAVDRRRLAEIVFRDQAALRRLEAIVHPAVRAAVFRRLQDLQEGGGPGVVTVEAIRLLESPLRHETDAVWLVTCAKKNQVERLTMDRSMSRDEISGRVASSPDFDVSLVDEVILNDGSRDDLARWVEAAWNRLMARLPM